jgi:tight adherence protein B
MSIMESNGWIWLLASCAMTFGAAASLPWALAPAWDRVSSRLVRDLTPQLQDLRINTGSLPYWLRLWGSAMVLVIVILGIVLQTWPLALTALGLVYVAPRLLIARMIARRRTLLRDQMVAATSGIANAVRAGLSLAQGIESVIRDTPEPLAYELRRIVFEWHRGRPLLEAIDEVRRRLQLDGFSLFAIAISACVDRGGNISAALERISHSLTENQRLERKLEADTASGRKVVVILACFPFAFLGLFFMLDPESTARMFTTVAGQVVLMIVIAIVYGSARWCGHLLNIDV